MTGVNVFTARCASAPGPLCKHQARCAASEDVPAQAGAAAGDAQLKCKKRISNQARLATTGPPTLEWRLRLSQTLVDNIRARAKVEGGEKCPFVDDKSPLANAGAGLWV